MQNLPNELHSIIDQYINSDLKFKVKLDEHNKLYIIIKNNNVNTKICIGNKLSGNYEQDKISFIQNLEAPTSDLSFNICKNVTIKYLHEKHRFEISFGMNLPIYCVDIYDPNNSIIVPPNHITYIGGGFGYVGVQGVQGFQGATGPSGFQGPTGPIGNRTIPDTPNISVIKISDQYKNTIIQILNEISKYIRK